MPRRDHRAHIGPWPEDWQRSTMAIVARHYADDDDYGRMLRFVTAVLPLVGTQIACTPGELDWWRFTEEDPDAAIRLTRLWFDGEELVAFSWPADDQIDVVHPDYAALQDEMLTWSEADHRQRRGPEAVISTFAYESDQLRQNLLRRHGYVPGDDPLLLLRTRPLDGELPRLSLPAGYTVRHVRGPEEAAARVAVHRASFTASRMTAEKYQRVMAAPSYLPELDLVAVAPDGDLAAFAIVWWDPVNRRGVFEPLGTAAAHQRRGLGRAIVAEGLRRLRALGAESAWITSEIHNPAANALYDTAGVLPVDRNIVWTKSLAPAVDPAS